MTGCHLACSNKLLGPPAYPLGWWNRCYMRMHFLDVFEQMGLPARLRFPRMGWRLAAQVPLTGWLSLLFVGKHLFARSLLTLRPVITWTTSSGGLGG